MKLKAKHKKQSGSAFVGILIGLAVLYFFVLMFSMSGWGYIGYGGYHHSPSWYWGGPKTYHGRSVRDGSVSGPSSRGGGYSSGK